MGAGRQHRSKGRSGRHTAGIGARVQVIAPRDQVGSASRFLIPALASVILAVGAWAWSTSFAGVLVLDDMRAVALNPTIRTMRPLDALSPPSASTVSARPVANATFAINYALAPADVRDAFVAQTVSPAGREAVLRNLWGYHFLNLAIHLAAALLLFGIARRTLLTPALRASFGDAASWLAFAIALLWVVHPLQTESVTYVVQRVESLAGLFYLLVVYSAIRMFESFRPEERSGPIVSRRKGGNLREHTSEDASARLKTRATVDGSRATTSQYRKTRWSAAAWAVVACAACAAGMATKETMVTAPVIVWLWARVFGDRVSVRARWALPGAMAATWLILVILVMHEHRSPSISLDPDTVWHYLLTQAAVIVHYVRLVFVPSPLVFLYTWFIEQPVGAIVPQVLVIGLLVTLTVLGCVRRHPLGFAGAWFFVILAPSSSFLPIVTEVAAEHRMYLPLASVIACVVAGCYGLVRASVQRLVSDPVRQRRTRFVAGSTLVCATVLLLGTTTLARNRDYWSEEGLWRDTVTKQPDNYRAHIAYGAALMQARQTADAEAQFRAAVAIAPSDPNAQSRLGWALSAQGKTDEAVLHLERSLAVRPDDAATNRLAGEAYASRHQDALAVAHLGRAADVMTDDPGLLAHLAAILADSSDPSVRDASRAVTLAERAAAMTGRREPHVLDVLAVAQASVGRYGDAASTAAEALGLARQQGNEQLSAELEYRVAAYSARQ